MQEASCSGNRKERMDSQHREDKGKDSHKEIVEFGERVWYFKTRSRGNMSAENRWNNGVRLGVREESGEYIIGAEKGIAKIRTDRRKGS